MKIQLLSDLHLEFQDWQYQPTDADVVVLAGDIHTGQNAILWVQQHIVDKPVLYVLGNHEYYGHSYPNLLELLRKRCEHSNISILENERVNINGVNFFGATLWTDFELFGDPRAAASHCLQRVNDFKRIHYLPYIPQNVCLHNEAKLRPWDVATIHQTSRNWLEQQLTAAKGERNVVISHHGPAVASLPQDRQQDITSAAYVSDLTPFIARSQPVLWLHGHIHSSVDYHLGNTRVCSNPKGYPKRQNPDFDPHFCLSL